MLLANSQSSSEHTFQSDDSSQFESQPHVVVHESEKSSKTSFGELMGNMPVEILSEIFYWSSSSFNDHSFPPMSPLYLSHVCRLWYHTVISTPRLWTYTKLCVRPYSTRSPIELLRLWTTRTKSCPLLIDIEFVEEPRPQSLGNVLTIFEEFVLVAKLLRPAFTQAYSPLESNLLVSSIDANPIVKERYFWSTGLKGSEQQAAFVQLRAVRPGVASYGLELHLSLHTSLTRLEIKDPDYIFNLTDGECVTILQNFPFLVHCTLHINYSSGIDVPINAYLEYLKTFSLTWGSLIDIGGLLDSVETPSLENLELLGVLPEVPMGRWDHLLRLLRRCRPPIRHLDLQGIDCFYLSLLDCLDLCSNLERLWLDDCILDDSIITGLYEGVKFSRRRGAGVLATLKTLGLVSCYEFSIDFVIETLQASVNDRNGQGLEHLYIIDCGEEVDDDRLLGLNIEEAVVVA